MIVLLDTNFLVLPTQFRIDIFNEIKEKLPTAKLATIPQVVRELEKLGKRGSPALQMIKKFNVKIIEANGKADDALLELAEKRNALLCTNDRELKKRAIAKGIAVIFMRKRKTLEVSGGLDV